MRAKCVLISLGRNVFAESKMRFNFVRTKYVRRGFSAESKMCFLIS